MAIGPKEKTSINMNEVGELQEITLKIPRILLSVLDTIGNFIERGRDSLLIDFLFDGFRNFLDTPTDIFEWHTNLEKTSTFKKLGLGLACWEEFLRNETG